MITRLKAKQYSIAELYKLIKEDKGNHDFYIYLLHKKKMKLMNQTLPKNDSL